MEPDMTVREHAIPRNGATFEELAPAVRNMVDGAIAVATGLLHIDQPDETQRRLAEADRAAIDYFRHELAHQVAMVVLRSDANVSAVYKEHELPEAEELGSPDVSLADPIRLVVYSERETAALRSLLGALDDSLARELSDRGITVPSGLILADVLDPAEVSLAGARSRGFRPPPTLLATREDRGSRATDDAQAL